MYAVLRDNFCQRMSMYRVAPPLRELDACYKFTRLDVPRHADISSPSSFSAALVSELLIEEMMYFSDPENVFSVGCLAFAAPPTNRRAVSVIGTCVEGR